MPSPYVANDMFDIPLHKLIVHFPIALAVIAALYDGWALYYRKPSLHDASYGMALWAGVSSLAAVTTGLLLAGVSRIDAGVLTGHTGFGIAAGIIVTFAAFVRYSARARNDRRYRAGWWILEAGAALLIIAAAITGHRL
jgi:uncharacterized membrane protein